MFDEILGLPAHPLLVHAAVVFVPLLVLVAVAYVLLPFLRVRLAWLLIVLSLAAPGAVWAAKESGARFERRLNARVPLPRELADQINVHQDHAGKLWWVVCGLAAAALLFVALDAARRRAKGNVLPPPPAAPGTLAPTEPLPAARGRLIVMMLCGVLVLTLSGFNAWYVYRTGDTGTQMVWGGS